MAKTDQARQILAWLQEREGEMLALLEKTVAINSHSMNKSGVDAVARVFKEAAEAQGMAVESRPGQVFGDNLVARTPACGHAARQILYCGHMDTVFPAAEGFTRFSRQGGKAFGPGVIDMKGGLVAGLFALRALDAFGLLQGLPVAFIFNSDEEIGSHESAALIKQEAKKSLFALVFECSGMDGGTVTGRKGKRTYGLSFSGRAGHAGNLTGPKPSAILELAQKTLALEALNDPARGVTVNVGRIEGGTGPNTIPGWATAQVDTRYATQADGDALHKAVQGLCAKCGVKGTSCETHVISARPAMEQTPANRELLSIAKAQGELLDAPVVEEFRGGVSDANLISHAGVPVLDGLGPAGEFDHSHDEYMLISSLAERAALTALLTAEAFKSLQNA